MKNKTFLTAVILSACIFLFICPEVSGRINKAGGYGAFAACDTWQKWAEHITGGDFKFTGFARYDNEESEELAAYVYDSFMTNADDGELATEAHDDRYMADAYGGEYMTSAYNDVHTSWADAEYMEYAYDMTDDYTVPEPDEWFDEEGWADLSYDRSYYSDLGYEEGYEVEYNVDHYYSRAYYDDEYSADEYASFYDDEQSDMDDNYGAGDYEADEEEDEAEYEDYPSEYEADACND